MSGKLRWRKRPWPVSRHYPGSSLEWLNKIITFLRINGFPFTSVAGTWPNSNQIRYQLSQRVRLLSSFRLCLLDISVVYMASRSEFASWHKQECWHFCSSGRPLVYFSPEPLDGFWWNLIFEVTSNSSGAFPVLIKSGIRGSATERTRLIAPLQYYMN